LSQPLLLPHANHTGSVLIQATAHITISISFN
jgi:hypothetical protein